MQFRRHLWNLVMKNPIELSSSEIALAKLKIMHKIDDLHFILKIVLVFAVKKLKDADYKLLFTAE